MLVGVVVAGGGAVVVHADEEEATVGVREGGDDIGDLVAQGAAPEGFGWRGAVVPSGLELDELAFAPGEDGLQFGEG